TQAGTRWGRRACHSSASQLVITRCRKLCRKFVASSRSYSLASPSVGTSDSSASNASMVGELPRQFLRKGLDQLCVPLGHSDRLIHIAERVLGDQLVPGLTQQEPDTRFVVVMTELFVDRRQVEVQLTGVARFEITSLQLHH